MNSCSVSPSSLSHWPSALGLQGVEPGGVISRDVAAQCWAAALKGSRLVSGLAAEQARCLCLAGRVPDIDWPAAHASAGRQARHEHRVVLPCKRH